MARELDERLVELQSLFEMSQVLNSSLQLRTTLNNLLLTPMGRMMISRGVVLVAHDNQLLELAALKGLPRALAGKKIAFTGEISEPLDVSELSPENLPLKAFFLEHNISLIIPLLSVQRTVGIMGLGAKLGGVPFSPSEVEYLISLSNIASSAIENALMYQKLELVNRRLDKKVQELRTLFEIGKELNATLERERIINLLIYAVMGELVVSRCYLFLREEAGMALCAARGLRVDDQTRQELSAPDVLSALSRIDHLTAVDGQQSPDGLEILGSHQLRLLIPMQIQEETRGLLAIGDKITQQPFQTDEVEFLSTLCNLAMISIEMPGSLRRHSKRSASRRNSTSPAISSSDSCRTNARIMRDSRSMV